MVISERVIDLYQHLHGIPELGFQELKTSEFLAESLIDAGYTVQTRVAGTGVIGTLDGKQSGPVLALRADMDALSHSVHGESRVMHSCGHDAHCAMVLTVAEAVAEQGIKAGTLKVLFQPAEETFFGATKLIEAGAIDDVDILLGMHLRPIQEAGRGQATPALCHSSVRLMDVSIQGRAAHGARPHLGINPIDAAAAIVNAVNAIRVNPDVSASIKVTTLQAGGAAPNAIAGDAKMTLDLRSRDNATMDEIIERAFKAIGAGAASVGASAEICAQTGVPAAEYDPAIVEIAKQAILATLGERGLLQPLVTPGGEDFHFYVKHKPSIQAAYIGLGCDLSPGLHHPDMSFETAALQDGVNIFCYMVDSLLGLGL